MADDPQRSPAPAPTAQPIRAALATPDVARILIWAVVARIPAGAVTILLVLRTRELGGDYAAAGTIVGAFAVMSGLSEPWIARLIDQLGQTRMLTITIPANLAAYAAAAAIPDSWSPATLGVAAALLGITYPQVGGMVRALLVDLLEEGDLRHAAFSLESGVTELQIVIGPPLLVTAVAGTTSAAGGLLAGGLLASIGGVMFARTRSSRAWRPTPRAAGTPGERLATGDFVLLVALMLTMGLGFGALEVGVTAFAEHAGHRPLAGLLFAMSAVGSLAGALVSARLGAPRSLARRLTAALAYQAVTTAFLALPHAIVPMAALVLVNGITIAPAVAAIYGLAATTVPAGRVTEGYGWLGLGIMGGVSLGALIAGALTTSTSTTVAFLVPAALVGAGWLLSIRPLERRWPVAAPDPV